MSASGKNIKVLIVDDEEDIRLILSRVLRRNGFITEVVEDGKEALERVKSMKPDIIILDVIMPLMDGIKACQALRGDSETRDIPIIFLTAERSVDRFIGVLPGAAIEHVNKPFNLDELIKLLQSLFKIIRPAKDFQRNAIFSG